MFVPMTIAIFLVAADGAMVVSSYAAIGSEMKQLQMTSWISTGYLLTMTSFQPMYGRLTLIFGKKQTLLFAYVVFTLGSFLSGLSKNINQLVFARALAGVGGGGLSIVPTIILTDVIDIKSRGTWQGVLNLIYATGSAVGGPLGGILAEYISWRWSFLLQVPAMVFAILMVYLTLHIHESDSDPTSLPHLNGSSNPFLKTKLESLPQSVSLHTKRGSSLTNWLNTLKRLDILGALTLILAIASLLIGLQRLSQMCYSITQPETYAPLSLSLILFILFLAIEFHITPNLFKSSNNGKGGITEPILPLHIVLNPSLVAAYLANFFGVGASMALFYHYSLYLQVVKSSSSTEAGVGLLPSVVGGALGSLIAGVIMKKTGGFYWETLIGYIALFGGAVVVAMGPGVTGTSLNVIGFAVAGYGNGHAVTTSLIALISSAGLEDQAIATSVSYLFRSLGSTISLSMGNAIVQSVLIQTLRNKVAVLGEEQNVMDLVRLITSSLSTLSTLDSATQDVIRESYEVALRVEFVVVCALAFCALTCAGLIKRGGSGLGRVG
ncbi:MFS general substrate transporter [Dendrothele bispora CBS 962.96]|uniref:MFS general substrate transporter n=1 Tax=Dendrothele bispora (strain CBS 962.96) TaxID=1314807 RepID=A0A4S8LD12_DENBC|nr:MFS general substrate transporter [Dendrothele bispora CBS 962.96]